MDRVDFYYKQLVTETEMDSVFDDAENGLWNLAVDIGLEGVVEGAVLTQTGTPSMNILASNPCRAYDQLGRRVYFAPQQTIDVSQDELGNPTVPGTGNTRWVMIAIEFDRLLSDLRTDGNGASVYYQRDEYFNVRVVNGVETSGTPVRPTAPSDALILGDILMDEFTTSILTGDIDLTRRQDFIWTSADKIEADASGFTKLSTVPTDVQAVLDDIDVKIIAVEADGDIIQDLIPPDNTKYLGSATQRWNARLQAATIYSGLYANADSMPLGDVTNRFDVFVYDGLVYSSFSPNSDGLALGTITERWTAYLKDATHYGDINIDSAARVDGNLIPKADANDLGSATLRWDGYFSSVTMYGDVDMNGNSISAALDITLTQNLQYNDWKETLGESFSHLDMVPIASSGWSLGTNYYENTGSTAQALYLPFHVPISQIKGFSIYWYQSATTTTNDMNAIMQKRAYNASGWTDMGSVVTIDTFGSNTLDTETFGTPESNTGSNAYRIKIESNGASIETCRVLAVRISYRVKNIGNAATGAA